jgi:hypothetical protein
LRRVFFSFVALVLVAGFLGCSSLQPRSPEEIIAERALAQARYLMDRDYDSALTYVVPSYQNSARAEFYESDFSGSSAWTDASVTWVRCADTQESDRCEVRLWIYGSLLPSSAGRGDNVPWPWNTVWVKIDGEWYQYVE